MFQRGPHWHSDWPIEGGDGVRGHLNFLSTLTNTATNGHQTQPFRKPTGTKNQQTETKRPTNKDENGNKQTNIMMPPQRATGKQSKDEQVFSSLIKFAKRRGNLDDKSA